MMMTSDGVRRGGAVQVLVYLTPPGVDPSGLPLSKAGRELVPRRTTPEANTASSVTQHVARLKKHFTRLALSQRGAPVARTASISAAESRLRNAARTARYYPHLGMFLGTVDEAGLVALRRDPAVGRVEPAPQLAPIRPIRRLSAAALRRGKVAWGIRRLRAQQLWKEGLSGAGVLVGHLDTGVDGRHPALSRGAIEHFAEFDRLGVEVAPAPAPYDTDDHGTHTAATIVGRPADSQRVGLAPGATLASAIVVEGGNVIARVLAGIDWCVGRGVRVLNMSLGLPGFWPQLLPLIRLLRQWNTLPVFAVGNEGPGTSRSPGNYSEALSVGAIDRRGRVARFSSSQTFRREDDPIVPDLVAPGVEVYSAKPGRGYQDLSGTSMATPHISGLAALLWEAKPEASVDEIEQAILASCDQRGIAPNRGGCGIPDGPRALQILQS